MNMLTLLQLSDIHFRKKPDELDEYSQMRVRMIETIEDYCKNETINAILICGDIAFSGSHAEYEDKAKTFISELLAKTGCGDEQVYTVPGNHDKDRNAKDGCTRSLLRDGLLYGNNGEQLLSQICHEDMGTFQKIISPFEEYIKYAQVHRCVSDAVKKTYLGETVTTNDKLYWTSELGKLGDYRVVLYGINSCLVSDWDDKDDPQDEKKGHLQYLSKQMYNINKHRDEINISMMHHPLDFLKDGNDIETIMDRKYAVQLYGHIHKPSAQKDGALKIFSGALQPPIDDVKKNEEYYPVFNIIRMDVDGNTLHVDIHPYVWKWVDDEDGVFEVGEIYTSHINVEDNVSTKQPRRKQLTLPDDETARGLEIRLMLNPHRESIIKKMYPDFTLNHTIADFEEFFNRLRKDDQYTKLYEQLK